MRRVKSTARLLAPLLATTALASPAFADPAIWKVSDSDSSIYLYGSVHLMAEGMTWRTSQFDSILAAAPHVYFEMVLDVDAYSTITQLSITKGRLINGQTLSGLMTPADHDRLVAAAAKVGVDPRVLDRLAPWLAAQTLTAAVLPKLGAGVEMLIDADVPADRKRGLETAAEQMGFFIDPPLSEQIDDLMSVVEGIESGEIVDLQPLFDAWQKGDPDEVDRVSREHMTERDTAMLKRLITDRNARWVTQLEKLLADNDQSLVIVGAAHLAGKDGVPTLLADAGYRVERVDAPEAPTPDAPQVKPR